MPRIHRIDIPQLVRVRKYEVDCNRLRNLLREQKKRSGKSNKVIAEALGVPVTKVEHWFRTDACFSIPDEDVWLQLKAELKITTAEFDEAITTFEERPGVFEKSERCYFATGIAPTLTSASAGNEKIIVGDYKMNEENKKVTATAMRGRYDESGCLQQHVEVSDREYANALTTVQKDSMVAESTIIGDTQGFDGVRFYNDYSPALRASRSGLKTVDHALKIRKLTPKECFRLMGFDDADFEKAEAVNSNSQLYKQAGNSIVVHVVQGIIQGLFDCGALEAEGVK
jgi:DNA (cytosine-5)-methyltransferase 1